MKVSIVSQYSVFLPNEPGALKKFAQVLHNEGLCITGLMSEVRYEAAVVRFVVESMGEGEKPVSRIITQAGYTSVKTEILCVEEEGPAGSVLRVSTILDGGGINITAIYGSCDTNKHGRMYINADDLERAVQLLSAA